MRFLSDGFSSNSFFWSYLRFPLSISNFPEYCWRYLIMILTPQCKIHCEVNQKESKHNDFQPELCTSLFEIAQSLFALEQAFILGAMALNKNKSNERTNKIQILSGSLMSNIRKRERSNLKSDFHRVRIPI